MSTELRSVRRPALVPVLFLLALACGNGAGEGAGAGTADPEAGRDTAAKAEATRSGTTRSAAPSPMTAAPPDSVAATPVRGQYTLARVDGQDLPVTTDEGPPGCVLQMVTGDLFLTRGTPARPERFRLRTATRRKCGEEVRDEAVYESSGSVSWRGDELRLSGEALDPGDVAGATGVVEGGGTVRITRVTGEGGERPVRWEFHRLHDLR